MQLAGLGFDVLSTGDMRFARLLQAGLWGLRWRGPITGPLRANAPTPQLSA